MESIPAASTRPTRSLSSGERVARLGGLRSAVLGRLRSVMRTSSMSGLRWGPTASSRPINRTACIQHGTSRGVRPILSNYGPTGRAYGGKASQLGGLCRDCQQKRGSDSRGRLSTRAFLPVRGRSAIVCDYGTALFLIQQRAGDSPNTYLMMGFSHLAAVVEAVRMWEAFFAFHICIACFLFRIRGNTWVSPRIPDRRNLLMLLGCFQVSVSIPSTTLGGMECHNSSGAQHRAYCGTNDCVTGDRQMRQERCSAERQSCSVLRWC